VQKPKKSLTEKLATADEAAAESAPPHHQHHHHPSPNKTPKKEASEEAADVHDENAVRYHLNVGGMQKGSGGGTTNFHVYTDESGNKKFSDELDPETERYIKENMMPKMGGKRKKPGSGGGVWSVFGDK
jgi:hypothetical protein